VIFAIEPICFLLSSLSLEAVSKWLSGVQLIDQGLGLLQIERVEAFDEPTVD
jgi:hypothetical protein